MSLLSDHDLYLFNEGSHVKLYDRLGSHTRTVDGTLGTNFAVWAPDAQKVSVMGVFNAWNNGSHPLQPKGSSGIWEGFIPHVGLGDAYKYHVVSRYHAYEADKKAYRIEGMRTDDNAKMWASRYWPNATPPKLEMIDVVYQDEEARPSRHLKADAGIWDSRNGLWKLTNGKVDSNLFYQNRGSIKDADPAPPRLRRADSWYVYASASGERRAADWHPPRLRARD